MRKRAGAIVVATLALLGFAGGLAGAYYYFALQGANDGYRAACHTVRTAEVLRLMSKLERGDVATQAVASLLADDKETAAFVVTYLMSDCSKPMTQFTMVTTKK